MQRPLYTAVDTRAMSDDREGPPPGGGSSDDQARTDARRRPTPLDLAAAVRKRKEAQPHAGGPVRPDDV
jgi:hypothetical protein